MNYFDKEPMKYFAPSSSMSKELFRAKLEQMASSNNYIFSIKRDGNWSRTIITPERSALQTRGISVKTKTYGEIQDKVLFWNDIVKAFEGTTCVFLGEIFREGDIDKGIGSILRCLQNKAIERQKDNPLHLYIFDVLCYDGEDLTNKGIEERIQYIPKIVKRINSPLVEGAEYFPMDETFFEKMNDIFSKGLEGAVCYLKTAKYEFGKRGPHAWESVKVKQEIADNIDCVIMSCVPCERVYNGGDISNWELWENIRTKELVYGKYFGEYQNGEPYEPVSRNYYNNYCGAIQVGVYDKNKNLIPLCNVSGLTDEFKKELRDNFNEWYLCPISITGMMISSSSDGSISVRHPKLVSIRREDILPEDCTLSKILAEN